MLLSRDYTSAGQFAMSIYHPMYLAFRITIPSNVMVLVSDLASMSSLFLQMTSPDELRSELLILLM